MENGSIFCNIYEGGEPLNLRTFFSGKRVLITGNTGFKGTWLAMMLHKLGAYLYGYALPPEENALYCLADVKMEDQIYADIRDRKKLKAAISDFGPEIIFHMAAHSSLYRASEIPYEVFDINVMGTVNLLETVRKIEEVKAVVVVTSDKCYLQQRSEIPYDETRALGAADPYSTSKACQELVAQCYRDSLSYTDAMPPRIATARASNTIGGGDHNLTRLIPYLIDCFLHGKTALLRNPDAIRPWQSVFDVLYGYLMLAKGLYHQALCKDTSFNFGPEANSFQPVSRVAQVLSRNFEHALYRFEADAKYQSEAEILKLDNQKASTNLGWKPLCSFEQTLSIAAEFSLQCRNLAVKKVCENQIEQYLTQAEERAAGL